MDEAELLAAARAGEQEAFQTLYQQQIGYVRTIARSILRRNDVEDVCQDTFLVAFTRIASFGEHCRFRTWVTRIAISQCLQTMRRARQPTHGDRRLVPLDAVEEDSRDGYQLASTDKVLEGTGDRLDMERLLRVLKPSQLRVLEMAYLEDMPELEIAAQLGSTAMAVNSTLRRAKRRVQKISEQQGRK